MAFIPSSGSVVAFQSNPANLQASVTGTVAITGSILSVGSGSVVAFQGTNPWVITGSVQASLTPAANQSVSGTVGASVIGLTPVAVTNTPSISGTVLIGNTVTINSPSVYGNISGSVVTFQGGTVITSITGTPAVSVQGTVFVSGSVITVGTAVANQSVSGTVGASIIGNVPVVVQSSVAVAIISGSIAASFTPPANQSVSGTVQTQVQASVAVVIIGGSILTSSTANQSVSGTVQISGNPSISGTVLATQNTTPWVISSVYGNVSGSVVAFQGTSPWVVNFQNSSIIAVQSGSVLSLQQGTWRVSVAGTYATGAASIISGLGILGLGVRNDKLASVFGTNGQYTPFTIGPVGEMVVAPAPIPQWTSGVGSLFTGVEQPIITSVVGSRINVTGLQIANASANNVYISLYGAGIGSVTGSIIGFTVAPANGGSNINYPIPLQTAINAGFSASVSGVASVFLSAQGFLSSI